MEARAVGVRWNKLRALGRDIYARGKPQILAVEGPVMAVGTLSAEVLIFKDRALERILTLPERQGGYGSVTSITIKENRIAVGYKLGYVAMWSGSTLALLSPPISQVPRPNSTANDKSGHLYGTAITQIVLDGDSLISGDATGVVIQHHNVWLLTEQKVHTRKLLGEYTPQKPTSVLSMILIKSILCVLTPLHFVVYSLASPEGVIFVLKNQQSQDDVAIISGDLCWNPELSLLGLCWGNTAQVLRLSWVPVHRQRPKFQCTAEKLWKSKHSLVKISFLGANYLLLLDISTEFWVLDLDTLEPIHKEPLHDKHIVHPDLFSESLKTIVTDSFASSLVFDELPLLILGEYELYMGTFINWADQIMAALNSPRPISALKLAIEYFKSDHNLQIIGLGSNDDRGMVVASMPDIIITLLRYTLEVEQANISNVLEMCLEAIILMELPLLESVYELMEPHQDEIILLHIILKLVLDGQIKVLEPRIYKRLVTFLSGNNLRTDLENVLLALDTSTLDLNLAFQLCNDLELETVYFYLTSAVLQEYVKPLETSKTPQRYDFLRASLCGVVYPTGQQMTAGQSNYACKSIYSALFGNTDHSFLIELIRDDADCMFDVLETAFEQSYLNEENEGNLNRQYLVSALRVDCKDDLRPYYAVFVAKSVAKYSQFIVLRGSELEKVLEELTVTPIDEHEYVNCESREFAASALLSVYTPQNFSRTTALLNEAKFYSALEQLYLQKRDYKNLLRTVLVHLKSSGVFMGMWQQLETCLDGDPSIASLVVSEAGLLASTSACNFADLVYRHQLSVYDDLDRMDDACQLALLQELSTKQLPPPKVINAHINLLARYDGKKLMETLREAYSKSNVQLPMVVDSLVEYDRTDALVLVMSRLGRDAEAMIYLLNHIETMEEGAEADTELAQYVSLGIDLCTKVSLQDLEQGEKLWAKLLQTISLLKKDVMPVMQALVHFTLEQAQSVPATAQLSTRVVGGLHKEGTNLLAELQSTMEQQELLITVMRQIFHNMSYREIMQVLQLRLTGWTLSIDGECEKCGEKVCGLGVNAEKLYNDWESRQKNIKLPESDALVVFRCTHVYHSRCLVPRVQGQYECIVCE